MKFSYDLVYDAPPADVHAMLADPAFREKVCTSQHAVRHEVTITPGASGMVVVVDQTLPGRGIPSFAKKVIGDEIQIVQTEQWSGETGAGLDLGLPHKPAKVDGRIDLAETGSGTVETVSGEVKVSLPFIGGKLEKLIADMLGAAIRNEERVGRRWLAGER